MGWASGGTDPHEERAEVGRVAGRQAGDISSCVRGGDNPSYGGVSISFPSAWGDLARGPISCGRGEGRKG